MELSEVREDMLEQMIEDTRSYISKNNHRFTDLAETVMEPPSTVDRFMRSCRKTSRNVCGGLGVNDIN